MDTCRRQWVRVPIECALLPSEAAEAPGYGTDRSLGMAGLVEVMKWYDAGAGAKATMSGV